MAMTTFSEFEAYYRKTGRLNMGTCMRVPSKKLNQDQLETAYQQYLKKMIGQAARKHEKAESKGAGPSPDAKLRKEIERRDFHTCRLIPLLNKEERDLLFSNCGILYRTLDAAHVFEKSAFPHMRYMKNNVVLLNRFSHNMLDQQKSPLTGKGITREMKDDWWKRILGKDYYEELEDISRSN